MPTLCDVRIGHTVKITLAPVTERASEKNLAASLLLIGNSWSCIPVPPTGASAAVAAVVSRHPRVRCATVESRNVCKTRTLYQCTNNDPQHKRFAEAVHAAFVRKGCKFNVIMSLNTSLVTALIAVDNVSRAFIFQYEFVLSTG